MNLKCVRTRYGILNATTLSVHNGGTNEKTNQSAVLEGIENNREVFLKMQIIFILYIRFCC